MLWLSISNSPSWKSYILDNRLIIVDLPAPVLPTSAIVLPAGTYNENLSYIG